MPPLATRYPLYTPGKIRRTTPSPNMSESQAMVVDLIRLPPYWYEDGDIHLVVENDNQVEHKFLVHRFMLCLQSPVFRDMVSLGENIAGKEDKIPTVPMKGDSVEDVRELLKVIYRGLDLCFGPELISFEGALGVLRLSHKYQMEQVKNFIVRLLQRSWPRSYKEYSEIMASLSDAHKQKRINRSIKLINAARLTESYELLPCAFYELANSDCTTWTFEDGAEVLCSEDWLRMTTGKMRWMERFRRLESTRSFAPTQNTSDSDQNTQGQGLIFSRPVCSGGAAAARGVVKYCPIIFDCLKSLIGRTVLDGKSAVNSSQSWNFLTFQSYRACEGCADWMSGLIKDKNIEIWDNVIADFGLPEVKKDEYTKTNPNFIF